MLPTTTTTTTITTVHDLQLLQVVWYWHTLQSKANASRDAALCGLCVEIILLITTTTITTTTTTTTTPNNKPLLEVIWIPTEAST